MKKPIVTIMLVLACLLLTSKPTQEPIKVETHKIESEILIGKANDIIEIQQLYIDKSVPKQETELSLEDFILLSNMVMAEAENQCFDAQYTVACVALNRLKSNLFPKTIHGVVYQSEPTQQFSCAFDGRLDYVIKNGGANDSCAEAVQSALEYNDLDPDVLYFTSCGYLSGTKPYCIIDNMYFSKQKVVDK